MARSPTQRRSSDRAVGPPDRLEALVEELIDEHTGEGDAFAELRVVLAEHPDADPALEAKAMAHLRARLGRVEAATDADAPAAGPEGLE